MGMIGSVGGTFGIFIGFSVTGFISSAIEFLKKFKHARRIYNSGNKEISKSDGNSVEVENDDDDNQTQILNENDFSRKNIQVKQALKSRSTQTREKFIDENRKKLKKRKQKI